MPSIRPSQLTAPLVIAALLLSSCEKVIDIEVPDSAVRVVFEGYIENDQIPYVIISRSAGYFDPIPLSTTAIADALVNDADAFVTVDGQEYPLDRICLSNIPPQFQEQVKGLLGATELPEGFDACLYVGLTHGDILRGRPNKSYMLRAIVDGEEYTSWTHIPQVARLDSIWFKLDPPETEYGYIWAKLNDPDTMGNSYYLWAKRLGKDNGFISVRGASFDDRFFNGERFDFNMARGRRRFGTPDDEPQDEEEDDGPDGKRRYFMVGDTVVVKIASIDPRVYQFWRSTRLAIQSGFNPFASPVTVTGNISDKGFGVWGGYGASFDTIICIPPVQ